MPQRTIASRIHWLCDLEHWHATEQEAFACERERATCPVLVGDHACGVRMQEWYSDGRVMCRSGHLLKAGVVE